MNKKSIFPIVLILLILGIAGYVFKSGRNRVSTVQIKNSSQELIQKDKIKKASDSQSENNFFVAGWLPYWAKDQGAQSLNGNLDQFSEINPFAFGVNDDGSLSDKMKLQNSPWPKLLQDAKQKNVSFVPTILWGDAKAMHRTFSDSVLLNNHVAAISQMLAKNNFPGVDIDYEGKDVADKDNFTKFLQALREKLQTENKTLSCTVEARTQDVPPEGFSGTRAMSWANDFKALGELCSVTRIMAYDQVFQIHRANSFDSADEIPSAPNAGNDWVKENIQYALKYIPAEKLVLGIPTYGWEFKFQKTSGGYHYDRFQSVVFPTAMEEARKVGAVPVRNSGGELSFTYKATDGQHIVTFADAQSVKEKIEIAKSFNLKGVSLFKLDGQSDPKLFSVMRTSLAK